ncbi:hypothetical protein [Haladaptatus pallidirubidus]|uniref:hypothetical protein n=1 Tax=Haladaptatus pallidirubidus TaxID=1008152 RepID=UPI001D126E2A|nr:hypothetical protein [Haladaptatus pallidirubidus]
MIKSTNPDSTETAPRPPQPIPSLTAFARSSLARLRLGFSDDHLREASPARHAVIECQVNFHKHSGARWRRDEEFTSEALREVV